MSLDFLSVNFSPRKRLFLKGLMVVVFFLFSGCGKRGDPLPPGPLKDSIYPRVYPPQ